MNAQIALERSNQATQPMKKDINLNISRPSSHINTLLSECREGKIYYIPRGYRPLLVSQEKLSEFKNEGGNNLPTSLTAYLPSESRNQVPHVPAPIKSFKHVTMSVPSPALELEGMQEAYSNFYSSKMEELVKCNINGEEASRIIMSIWQNIDNEERALFR
ncbi:hypothetical protein K7432_001174 [Basidiobolus ranarum]|uniref:Uncharacterized protein n=1 Tax=Basidiobolus ranarum TaxID=34480 RepID=A0ABR2WA15_9FUNG